MTFSKQHKLYLFLVSISLTNALTSEIIGSKLFSLEQSFGLPLADLSILGVSHLSFTLTAGVIAWPLVFTITDIINDYYGVKAVRLMSYLGVLMIAFMFVLLYLAIRVAPNDFWLQSKVQDGISNMQTAYQAVLGQGLNIIVASITAFLVGQLVDAVVFRQIKTMTGDKPIWLRALLSTLISQCVDTVVVLFIAFYLLQGYPLNLVGAWMITAYIYKFVAALAFVPLVYLSHILVERYLGHDDALKMRQQALLNN